MNIQYVSTRIINDVIPIVNKNNYKKLINPEAFILLCKMFHDGEISNHQFKNAIKIELEEVNK